jgi:hypothetical protein
LFSATSTVTTPRFLRLHLRIDLVQGDLGEQARGRHLVAEFHEPGDDAAVARSAPVDLLAHERLILAIGGCSGLEQPVSGDRDRIVLRNTLQVGPVAFSVALKVTPQTQRVHLDEGQA